MNSDSTRIKRLMRDNIKLMMKLRMLSQNLEKAQRNEQLLQNKLSAKKNKEEFDDDVFYTYESSLDLHPDSCVFCRNYENSVKIDSVKSLEEFMQRNLHPKSCNFCKIADCEI